MSDRSAIEWCDSSWNPIRARNLKTGKIGWHCEHATTGCEFCYAEGINKRLGTGLPFKPGHRKDIEIFLDEEMLLAPLKWKRPRKIFLGSMTDLFADFVTDEMLDKIFAVMTLAPHHTYQLLTKRAERMRDYILRKRAAAPEWVHLPSEGGKVLLPYEGGWPTFIWLGVSCERQEEADERIPLLLQTPAAVRFVSAEPLLGAIDLEHLVAPEKVEGEDWRFSALQSGDTYYQRSENAYDDRVYYEPGDGPYREHALDWIIAGGESGPNARPLNPEWVRALIQQARAAEVSIFVKQLGARPFGLRLPDRKGGDMAQWPDDLRIREFPPAHIVRAGSQAPCPPEAPFSPKAAGAGR